MLTPLNKWNKIFGALILYSVAMFFIEVELNGLDTPSTGFFLWSERIVACVFTIEYFARWRNNKRYPVSFEGIIDLVGFLPFWIGFFISIEHLRWVRTLRVLRILKFNRYNEAIKHFCQALKIIRQELNLLGFISVIIIIFSAIAIYEVEHDAENTKFLKLSDGLWWALVTLTTIGYGDVYPVTNAGRIVATLTIISGIGVLSAFISLMGTGLLQAYKNAKQSVC